MQAFRALAEDNGICIAAAKSVYSSSRAEEFDKIVESLEATPTAHVVVCFCEGHTVQKLLTATSRKGKAGKYLLIGRYATSGSCPPPPPIAPAFM